MSASSNYVEERVLDFWLKNNSLTTTAPATVHVALFNTDDSTGAVDQGGVTDDLESGTITAECSGGGYSRQAVTFGTITNGAVSNSGNLTWTTATDGNWGTITHVAVMDAASAGNVLFYGALDTAREILQDDTFQITTGSLTITLA